jgi:uncharacterized short protein YbdD (DUF466 family)
MIAADEDDRDTAGKTCDEGGLRLRLRGLCSACRQVLGIPDYERYLAHVAQRHPGAPVLTRGGFCAREFERKYGRAGPRCC